MMPIPAVTFTIREMTVPRRLDAEDAAEFYAMVALSNAVCRAETGLADFDETAQELLPGWLDDSDEVLRTFVAVEDDVIVGAATLWHGTAEPTSVSLDLMVLPENWGRGIEQALLETAQTQTRLLGREVLQSWTMHRADAAGADTLEPATGWGRVTATPIARLLMSEGFTLEQVERNSAFDLQGPMEGIRQRLDESLAFAGEDYRLVEWTLPTPPQYQAGYAWALSRMSTDAPSGGLEIDEETWDEARLARREARFLDGGQTVSVAAVQHVPSGSIVAFNELVIGSDPGGVTHQYATLVLREHRGHRLGMLVKCANILRMPRIAAHSPRITTFNAEENRPMLDINEALGFVPRSYAGAWQKKLS